MPTRRSLLNGSFPRGHRPSEISSKATFLEEQLGNDFRPSPGNNDSKLNVSDSSFPTFPKINFPPDEGSGLRFNLNGTGYNGYEENFTRSFHVIKNSLKRVFHTWINQSRSSPRVSPRCSHSSKSKKAFLFDWLHIRPVAWTKPHIIALTIYFKLWQSQLIYD